MSVGAVNKNTGDRIPTAGNPLDKVGNLASLHTTAKDDAVSAINEVTDEMQDKTDNDAVAPEFNNTTAYSTGELVYKDGQLYKFDSDHAAGAWDSSEVSPTTVAAEFNQLKNTLTANTFVPSVTLVSGEFYTCPSDGYLEMNIRNNAEISLGINSTANFDVKNTSGTGNYHLLYVKKGMVIKAVFSDGYVVFRGLS